MRLKSILNFLFTFDFILVKPVFAQTREWSECMTPEGVPTLKCLEVVFGNLLYMVSGFIVFGLFVMFVIGSLKYLTSGGNPEVIKKAQGTLKWAVIGTLLFVSSFLILKIIDCLFLGCQNQIFKFEIPEYE